MRRMQLHGTKLMDETYSFGYWVRRRRKALDLTQRALADCAGCAPVTLKKIEADERRPSALMANRLATCLGITGTEQPAFLAMALGQRPSDVLSLPHRPLSQTPDRIPQPLTPLLGREPDCDLLLDMLAQPAVRLISLVGPGGMGKTRLALAVAAALRQQTPHPFADGIQFVDLVAATRPDDLWDAIAQAFDFPLDRTQRESRNPARQLQDFLARKEVLLLLDNFEQLRPLATWLDNLLQGASRLKLLVTSRERLGLTSEHVYRLAALACPTEPQSQASAAAAPAVQLFVATAQRLQPQFRLTEENYPAIVAICRLVGGLPLALELAAGWIDTLPLATIATELSQGPALLHSELQDLAPRHQDIPLILAAGWARLPSACLWAGSHGRLPWPFPAAA
jgi:transcriptional regulator with XRE-family HTH domain